ncbi:MAG TPA: RNA polymerase sigma factor [Longimicrobiales bacterium]|nr:RNA polymerase sigma factor [Longimicrobiales bacterium]
MNHPARRLRTPEERVGCLPNACLPPPAGRAPSSVESDETLLARALGEGDEEAVRACVDRLSPSMLRLAMRHVNSQASAEEVVQEAWLAALKGFSGFRHRSAIRTWLFQILRNLARRRGRIEARWRSLSDLTVPSAPDTLSDPSPDPSYAIVAGNTTAAGVRRAALWTAASDPERDMLSRELADRIDATIALLPARMRDVLVMRDVEGRNATEVCHLLGLTDSNQRVILHRARDRVRTGLREYLAA